MTVCSSRTSVKAETGRPKARSSTYSGLREGRIEVWILFGARRVSGAYLGRSRAIRRRKGRKGWFFRPLRPLLFVAICFHPLSARVYRPFRTYIKLTSPRRARKLELQPGQRTISPLLFGTLRGISLVRSTVSYGTRTARRPVRLAMALRHPRQQRRVLTGDKSVSAATHNSEKPRARIATHGGSLRDVTTRPRPGAPPPPPG